MSPAARGAKQTTHHGPLQRLLDISSTFRAYEIAPSREERKREKRERLHGAWAFKAKANQAEPLEYPRNRRGEEQDYRQK
jgi:hypothetical protein